MRFQVKSWLVHLEQGIKKHFQNIPEQLIFVHSAITLITWHNLQRSWRRYFFYRIWCGKGISFISLILERNTKEVLVRDFDKVGDTTVTEITFTLLMKKEELARNALKPSWQFESMYGEKKSKMIINVIKIFCKCISILRLKGWIVYWWVLFKRDIAAL